MKTLGIDFGERRIGLAISDPDGRIAVPLETLERIDDRRALRTLLAIIRRERIECLVVGDPRRSDGSAGSASARVVRFAERLRQASSLPLRLIDESLTSVAAEELLRETGAKRARERGLVDATAAQLLLQESLDRTAVDRVPPSPPPAEEPGA